MKVGDAALEYWLESDTWAYCIDVVSNFDGIGHTYSWSVDFYKDQEDDTEPMLVKEGTEKTFETALSTARGVAFKHRDKLASIVRAEAKKRLEARGRIESRGAWVLK